MLRRLSRQLAVKEEVSNAMTKVAQFAQFTSSPGAGDQVVAALRLALQAAASEDGTKVYAIHASPTNPDVVWMYELYEDEDARQAHSNSEATAALRSTLSGLLAEPPIVTVGTLGESLGLE